MELSSIIYAGSKRLKAFVERHQNAIARALIRGDTTRDCGGVIVDDMFKLSGTFFHRVIGANGRQRGEWLADHNLIVDQGILKMLGVMYFTDTKITAWYLSLFDGAANPAANTTAANYASTMGEITSTTEGFSNATRPVWTPAAPAANIVTNSASKAAFTVVCTTSIDVTGGALISEATRGGTTGVLSSASRFGSARELFNGETFELGYQIALTN